MLVKLQIPSAALVMDWAVWVKSPETVTTVAAGKAQAEGNGPIWIHDVGGQSGGSGATASSSSTCTGSCSTGSR